VVDEHRGAVAIDDSIAVPQSKQVGDGRVRVGFVGLRFGDARAGVLGYAPTLGDRGRGVAAGGVDGGRADDQGHTGVRCFLLRRNLIYATHRNIEGGPKPSQETEPIEIEMRKLFPVAILLAGSLLAVAQLSAQTTPANPAQNPPPAPAQPRRAMNSPPIQPMFPSCLPRKPRPCRKARMAATTQAPRRRACPSRQPIRIRRAAPTIFPLTPTRTRPLPVTAAPALRRFSATPTATRLRRESTANSGRGAGTPGDIGRRIQVGGYYLEKKNWKAAQSRFESAMVLSPDDPGVYWGLAEAARHLAIWPLLAATIRRWPNTIRQQARQRSHQGAQGSEIANAKAQAPASAAK